MLLPLCPPLLVVVEPLLAVLAAHHEGAAVGEVGGGGALAAVSQSANRRRNHHGVVMFGMFVRHKMAGDSSCSCFWHFLSGWIRLPVVLFFFTAITWPQKDYIEPNCNLHPPWQEISKYSD